MHRRSFIEMFIAGTAGYIGAPVIDFMDDEALKWKKIKRLFPDGSSPMLNLNNGSAGMIPSAVENQLYKFLSQMNNMAPYEALGVWDLVNKKTRVLLADLIGADKEEVAIVRNTTEALNYVFKGIDIPKNSTVVCAIHDYGHSINILERLSHEKGFQLKYVDVSLPTSNNEIIKSYEETIDDSCSLVLITAMTHREGQILPVKEISKIAKRNGALVVVDAAHSIGHYEHSVEDWDCDYYCTSLHKWLSCPIGSGLLYMKKDLISRTKGSYSASKKLDDQMSKFEVVGTKPFAIEASILSALHFQSKIGLKTKSDRLKVLTDYWTTKVNEIPMVHTFKPEEYGGISTFHFPGSSLDIMSHFSEKKIHIKKVSAPNYNKKYRTRYRVSPNIYHDFKDLDRLIDAMKTL